MFKRKERSSLFEEILLIMLQRHNRPPQSLDEDEIDDLCENAEDVRNRIEIYKA